MFLLWSKLNDLNFSDILSLLTNVRSLFISSPKGKHKEFFIEPLLKPFLGSATIPSNLSLLLASTTLKSFLSIFSSICFLFLTSSIFSLHEYIEASVIAFLLFVVLFSFFHFLSPPSRT